MGEEYQAISDRVLTAPKNTSELMALIAYTNDVENKTLFDMEERLYNDVMKYILFLIDHISFSAVEMKQNNQTFQWSVVNAF